MYLIIRPSHQSQPPCTTTLQHPIVLCVTFMLTQTVKKNILDKGYYDMNALVQLIGYVVMPWFEVLSAVWTEHENDAALPYCTSYHPTAHCKLHTLSLTGLRTITLSSLDSVSPLPEPMSVWSSCFLLLQELSTGPAWLHRCVIPREYKQTKK